jgi:hypothetical protein
MVAYCLRERDVWEVGGFEGRGVERTGCFEPMGHQPPLLALVALMRRLTRMTTPPRLGGCLCGTCHRVSIATSLQLSLPLPRYRQLDWDAILTPTLDEFVEASLVRNAPP